jgi:IS5 family transposase
MKRQMTLAELNDELGAARANKKEFLDKLESIIPWDNFIKIIQPSYYKGELGNKPYPLELLLRIFILQNVKTGSPYAFINGVGADFDFGGIMRCCLI